MESTTNSTVETTDSWPWGKIIKHVILPKPKGSPKAGKKEIGARIGIGAMCGVVAVVAFSGSSLPTCSSSDTVGLVEQIVNDLPIAKMGGTKFVELKDIEELGFNERSEIRSCGATLITTAGEDDLQYSIIWENKEKARFYVEAQVL